MDFFPISLIDLYFWWVILGDVPRELLKVLSFGLSSGKPETTKLQPVFEGPSEFGRPCRVIQAQEAKKYTHEAIQVVTLSIPNGWRSNIWFSGHVFTHGAAPQRSGFFSLKLPFASSPVFLFKGSFLVLWHSENSKNLHFSTEKNHICWGIRKYPSFSIEENSVSAGETCSLGPQIEGH